MEEVSVLNNFRFQESCEFFLDYYLWQNYSLEEANEKALEDIAFLEEIEPFEFYNNLYGILFAHWKLGFDNKPLRKRVEDIIDSGKDIKALELFIESKKYSKKRKENLNKFLDKLDKPCKKTLKKKSLLEKNPVFRLGDVVRFSLDCCTLYFVIVGSGKSNNRKKLDATNTAFICKFSEEYSRQLLFSSLCHLEHLSHSLKGELRVPQKLKFKSDQKVYKDISFKLVDNIMFDSSLLDSLEKFRNSAYYMNTNFSEMLKFLCETRLEDTDFEKYILSHIKGSVTSLQELFIHLGYEKLFSKMLN